MIFSQGEIIGTPCTKEIIHTIVNADSNSLFVIVTSLHHSVSDFNKASQQQIQEQVLQAMGHLEISNAMSVALSVTTPRSVVPSTNAGRGRGSRGRGFQVVDHTFFVCNVTVLATSTALKCIMLITIQRNLPHIVLQFGTNLDCPNCPSICCAFDLCPTLTTWEVPLLCVNCKMLYILCCKGLYSPGLCTNHLFRNRSISTGGCHNQIRGQLPLTPSLQDQGGWQIIPHDCNRSQRLHQHDSWSALHAGHGDDTQPC